MAKIEKMSAEVREQTARLNKFEYAFEEARELLEKERLALLTMQGAEHKFNKFVEKKAREVLRLREVIGPLSRERDTLTEVVRVYVTAKPTGWVKGATVEENHLVWVSSDGMLKVVLVDSPVYSLSVDDLIALVGIKNATNFLNVNYRALMDAAETGALVNDKGEIVTSESIISRRERKPRAKRVDIDPLDPRDATSVVQVINPELAQERVEALESLGLGAATITVLRDNGVQTAYQLRNLSGEELSALHGIGPVRAREIIDAVIERAR